jgi:hypothetical protein
MAKDINDKYVQQTMDALSDSRLLTGSIAIRIAQMPVREQIRFFKLLVNYIDIMADYGKNKFAVLGMESVVKACVELMDVVELHFPVEPVQQMTFNGMEYIQL